MSNEELAAKLTAYGVWVEEHDKREMLLDATKERGKTLVELASQIELVINTPENYDAKAAKKAFKGEAAEILRSFANTLKSWDGELHFPAEYHAVLEKFVETQGIGFGKIAQPLRVSLLGSMTGSGMDEIMAIIGVDETVDRIEKAIEFIKKEV